jgi:hypothetical protein
MGTLLFGTVSGFINRLGAIYDSAFVYVFFRVYIREPADVIRFSKLMALMLLPVALIMLYDKIAHYNLFSYIGGVRKYSLIRGGTLRATGPFAHPILAGNVAAISFPFFYYVIWSNVSKYKIFAYIGLLAALSMIVACGSSGPILTLFTCMLGVWLWAFRQKIKSLMFLGAAALVALHLVMNDPVWYLAARVDLAGGSAGWHRAKLISSAIAHLGEWWLVGTEYTRHWMPTGVTWNPNHTDITNQYILIGINGGLAPIILLILIIWQGLKFVDRMRKYFEGIDISKAKLVWVLGSVLFCHAVTFMSVAYFDQTISFFYGLLAMISSLYNYTLKRTSSKIPVHYIKLR